MVKVHVVGVCCDLPAKALVQNYIQFNGAFGCGFCKQPGEVLVTDKGGHVVSFPFIADNPKGPPRTQKSCIDDAHEAMCTKSVVSQTK